jgi:hypothetical protein
VSQQESMLVISAHAADFGGRAGGAVALADGQLGLDLYGLRNKLAARGVEYVPASQDMDVTL